MDVCGAGDQAARVVATRSRRIRVRDAPPPSSPATTATAWDSGTPDRALARTKPGSRARTILSVFAALANEMRRGVTIAEVRLAYPRFTGQAPPATLTSEAASLAKREILVATGGRSSRTEYAPLGCSIVTAEPHEGRLLTATNPVAGPEDGAMTVLRAVEALCAELGRPVSTREVAARIARDGARQHTWNANTVRKFLETLSKRRTRGAEGMRAPQVIRVAEARAVSGAPSAHWTPAAAEEQSAESLAAVSGSIAPRSAADALRRAIGQAQAALGRPINEDELAWWLASDASDAGGPALRTILPPEKLTATLASLYRGDRRYHGQAGRVHDAWTLYTAHGGPSPYYSLGLPDGRSFAQCWFEDTVASTRVADEVRGLAAVARRATLSQSISLEQLAATRRSALAYLLHWSSSSTHPMELLADAVATRNRLATWLAATPVLSDEQRDWRRRLLAERDEAFRSARVVLETFGDPPRSIPRHANSSTAVRLDSLTPYLEEAAARRRVDVAEAKRWLSGARRFKNLENRTGSRFGALATHPLSVVDRVDALRALYAVVATPKQRAMLTAAEQVLGHVLRDGAWLHARLIALRDHEVVARRALVVSLGLLGTRVDYALACPSRDDSEDASAWVFSTVLADISNAAAVIGTSGQGARGAAGDVLDTARSRIAMGFALAASG